MSNTDVIKFPGRNKPLKPAQKKQVSAKGARVRAAQNEAHSNDPFLTHMRDVLTGPYQRISEARFEEMLDILMEQDDYARGKFLALESGLQDVAAETSFLKQKYDALSERIEIVADRTEAARAAIFNAFEESMNKLRQEFEAKSTILSETLVKSLKNAEVETRNALSGLSTTVADNKRETERLYAQVQNSTAQSLEARIAQWRAEIEDERKEDMSEVAAALMEIGKRISGARKPAI
jgi:hypothetical protein